MKKFLMYRHGADGIPESAINRIRLTGKIAIHGSNLAARMILVDAAPTDLVRFVKKEGCWDIHPYPAIDASIAVSKDMRQLFQK